MVFTETLFVDPYSQIQGFSGHHTTRVNQSRGVSVYIENCLMSTKVAHLSKVRKTYEICTVKLTSQDVSIFNLGIYRSPSRNINEFIDELYNFVSNSFSSDSDIILIGDINVNMLGDSNTVNNLSNMFSSLSFTSLITDPTRETNNSSTLIDQI